MSDPVILAFQNLIGHRRDLDIRPIPFEIGLIRSSKSLKEVHHVDLKDFDVNSEEQAERMHDALTIPKIDHFVGHYLGSGSVDINQVLWNHHLSESPIPNHILRHIKSIDSHMKDRTEGNFRLYSGLPRSPAHISAIEWNSTRPKKLIHVPSYISTTTDMDTAIHFTREDSDTKHHESDHHGIILPNARHIIELNFLGHIKNAASMKDHSGANEDEILLGRDHQFELHPRPTLIKNSGYSDPIYVWKADSFGAQKQKKTLY